MEVTHSINVCDIFISTKLFKIWQLYDSASGKSLVHHPKK